VLSVLTPEISRLSALKLAIYRFEDITPLSLVQLIQNAFWVLPVELPQGRIIEDVLPDPIQFGLVSYDVFVVIPLPLERRMAVLAALCGHGRLESSDYNRQRIPFRGNRGVFTPTHGGTGRRGVQLNAPTVQDKDSM
jgi:hypothetical protein